MSDLKDLRKLQIIYCDKDVDVSPLKHLKNLIINKG